MTDLLTEDVRLRKALIGTEEVHYISVKLKSTKSCRRLEKGCEIEVFEVGGPLCPVKAWRRYRKMTGPPEAGMPAFRQQNGLAYSHSMLNRELKQIFAGRVQYGAVSGHSFRIGLATLLAERGYSDEGIRFSFGREQT